MTTKCKPTCDNGCDDPRCYRRTSAHRRDTKRAPKIEEFDREPLCPDCFVIGCRGCDCYTPD